MSTSRQIRRRRHPRSHTARCYLDQWIINTSAYMIYQLLAYTSEPPTTIVSILDCGMLSNPVEYQHFCLNTRTVDDYSLGPGLRSIVILMEY